MKLPFIGSTAKDRYDDNSSQLSQNWYVHSNGGKQSLYPTPGETLFTNIGTGEIRGEINYNGTYYIISGSEFYEVAASGNGTLRGTLNTTTGWCRLAHNGANNGQQISIVDGTNGYIYNSQYQTFAQTKQYSSSTTDGTTADKLVDSTADFVTDGVLAGTIVYNTTDGTKATVTAVDDLNTLSVSSDIFVSGETYEVGTASFPDGATHVQFFDSYFLYSDPNVSGRFYKSASYDGTDIDGLDFATAERSPDELQGLLKSDRYLWLVGKDTAEVWFNSGASFPFEPVPSGFSEWGTSAPYSLVQTSGLSFWLSQNEEGNGLVVQAAGAQVKIISTPEIAAQISTFSDLTNCYSFTYQKDQHTFIVFTFPSDETTLVYDTTEKQWHTWHSKTLGYHRSTGHTFVYNKHLVGDPVTGKVYELDWGTFTEDGDMITRRRITTTFKADGDKSIDYQVIELEMKQGVGNADIIDPQVMLRWRDNNGAWSNWHTRSMGKTGERDKKIRFRRTGDSPQRVFEIQVTDPVACPIFDGYARIEVDEIEAR